jgi:hypothetical protein
MVEIHYEEERADEATGGTFFYHWRVIVNDETAALAQVAQDFADGRGPLAIVECPAEDPWDAGADYDPGKWKALMSRKQLRKRAAAVGAAFS